MSEKRKNVDDLEVREWAIDKEVNGEERIFTVYFYDSSLEEEITRPFFPICSRCRCAMSAVEYPSIVGVVKILDTTDTTNTPFGEEKEIPAGRLFNEIVANVQIQLVYEAQFDESNQCSSCHNEVQRLENAKVLQKELLGLNAQKFYEPRYKL